MDTVFELRTYRLRPGARERLIGLFERSLVEPQRAAGMSVLGRYRVPADPDSFVWMRGFPSMEARTAALEAFYGGPAWHAHRDSANGTMINSDNVLLLRPAWAGSGIAEGATAAGVVVATISHGAPGTAPTLSERHRVALLPLEEAEGGTLLGAFVTEHAANAYPRLPVRAGAEVYVRLVRYPDAAAAAAAAATARASPAFAAYDAAIWRPDEVLVLDPV